MYFLTQQLLKSFRRLVPAQCTHAGLLIKTICLLQTTVPLSGVGTESAPNDNDDSGQSEFGSDLTGSNSGIAGLANDNNNKVKFSTKGLNAQQLQLIEKLLKEKKGTGTSKSHPPVSATTSPVTTTSGGGASLSAIAESNAAAALAAVQSPPKGPVKPPQQVWSFTRIKQVWPLTQFFSVSFL